MNLLAQLISPELTRLIALTLLHFLWQGTALAAIAYAGMATSRTAQSRYVGGLAIVVLMGAAPAVTYFTLRSAGHQLVSSTLVGNVEVVQGGASAIFRAHPAETTQPQNTLKFCFWLEELWFAGVIIFSVRSAGGVLLVEQLRRRESRQVSEDLLALCLNLKRKLGLQRMVLFCECSRLDAPAAAGWLRPTILIPITALTGLSAEQLSSIIAHELAHIKRYDSLVNLFQVAVETFLFYHPAVWWLNNRVREERENCCDDMAVSLCGNPLAYAHALARLAGGRTSPRLLMAAHSHPLAARVARVLGVRSHSGTIRRADLSMGILCLCASLLAGGAFFGAARNVQAQQQSLRVLLQVVPAPPTPPVLEPAPRVLASVATLPLVSPVPAPAPAALSAAKPVLSPLPAIPPVPPPAPQSAPVAPTAPQAPSSGYIDGMKAAGLENLTVDELIALKIQGVTPEYVKEIHELGLRANADELVGMKIQGITPDYIRTMRDAGGQKLGTDELIGMKIQGVTPEYLKKLHDLGLKTEGDKIIEMKVQGVTPEYVQEMRKLDLKTDTDDVISLKVQGVTPEYVESIRALGVHPDTDELIGMKVQGVTADYLKKLLAAGFKVDPGDAISAKVMGITSGFIEKVRSHGFKDLSLQQLIALKQSGALDSIKE